MIEVQAKKKLTMVMMAALVLSLYVTPVVTVTTVSNIWTSPQIQGSFTKDYYEIVGSTGLPDNTYNRHIGRVDVTYYVKYISNDDPSYDYYSIAIQQTVTPAIAMSGAEHDLAIITSGITYFRLRSSEQIVDDILPRSGTTGTCTYGIGAQFGWGRASFTSTGSLSIPNVFVSGYKSSSYGSTNNWVKFLCDEPARTAANTYRWTALVKVYEGGELYVDLVFKTSWQSSSIFPGFPIYPSYEETAIIRFDGTPSGGGGGGGGNLLDPW